MELLLHIATLNGLLPLLAIIAGIFVITTKNAIISVFNLIVLYILVSFYLIYIGVTYLGISYIIIYIGAIAILFLFIIMMIDIEVVEKRSNNYLPLLFLFLSGFLFSLKKCLHNIGLIKMKSLSFKEEKVIVNESHLDLYSKVESVIINNNKDVEYNYDYNSKENYNYENINDSINNDNEYYYQKIKDESDELSLMLDYIPMESDIIIPWYQNNFEFLLQKAENIIEAMNYNEIFTQREYQDSTIFIDYKKNYDINIIDNKFIDFSNYVVNSDNHFLLINPSWDSVINRITQITAIGDVLYTVYHSYIYIVSVILLLGMVGAIILTGNKYQEVRILNISRYKKSSLVLPYYLINIMYKYRLIIEKIWSNNICNKNNSNLKINIIKNKRGQKYLNLFSYYNNMQFDNNHSEGIIGNLSDFIIAIILVAFLLLSINSYLSLNIKYLEKGGGFECGFTSFLQTRERYNIYFYRVSLLFLVFDLEIILAFPYTAIYQKNQNMGKNNILAFLFLLIVGFIFELKEGALNIVKKAHSTEMDIKN